VAAVLVVVADLQAHEPDKHKLHELGVDARSAPAILRHRSDETANLSLDARAARIPPTRDLRPVSPESFSMPASNSVGVDDHQAARPCRPRAFERCHLPQSQVFNHEVGSTPTHRPDRTGAERDDEYENMEHSGRVWLFPPRNLKRGSPPPAGATAVRKSLISNVNGY